MAQKERRKIGTYPDICLCYLTNYSNDKRDVKRGLLQ